MCLCRDPQQGHLGAHGDAQPGAISVPEVGDPGGQQQAPASGAPMGGDLAGRMFSGPSAAPPRGCSVQHASRFPGREGYVCRAGPSTTIQPLGTRAPEAGSGFGKRGHVV